uniref:Uncharacterized protein n=1 Tax=Meloidogyne enterolobii TaxID=390850 RepID=A0A6V7Y7K7_MELEN|nr:unnamed protein product [Meloidogyne enterolobii]
MNKQNIWVFQKRDLSRLIIIVIEFVGKIGMNLIKLFGYKFWILKFFYGI